MRILILLLIFQYGTGVDAMELKGTHSCQNPLMNNSKIITSSADIISNRWCPSSFDNQPYLLISLSNLTYMTRLIIKTISSDMYYHLQYTRDDIINQYTIWRSYRLLNNKQENIQLDPPIIVKHIRLNIKEIKINACFQLELYGCVFTDGVVSYSMLQGSHQFEDDTYDGQYNIKHRYLYDGLGQLSDGQTGPDNYEDTNGIQWVGWRKPNASKLNHSIEILFKFDALRNFSRMTIHTNNYFPKKIHAFHSAMIEFLNNNHSSSLTYNHLHDDQFEMARPIMIDLKHHIASQIKLRLYFHGNRLLISEVTFDSFIVPNLVSDEFRAFDFSMTFIISCILALIIVSIVILIITLTRIILNKKRNTRKSYFTPMRNHTESSASTTSSEIDVGSSHHRYATIGSNHPYLVCSHGSVCSPYNSKFVPTTSLLRSPSTIQQYHIEGICGNSSYSTQRLFAFDLSQNQFIPTHKVHIRQQIENRHQVLGGGEICQGELQVNQSLMPITIRRLRPDASIQSKISFFNETSVLTSLCHPNIVHVYGFCAEPTISLLVESFDSSTMDLYRYLQHHQDEQPVESVLYNTTIYFAAQIASALAYLESLHICHRDIAARNCFVTAELTVKLHDLAMSNEMYADDYVSVTVGNKVEARRPIRWCAWETICLNQFTSKSDVYSFGVLLWEILTMAERPYNLLDDEQVLFNLQNCNLNLVIPVHAADLTDLILSCWNTCDHNRPSFYQLNQVLCQKQQQQQSLTIKSDTYQHMD